MPQWEDNKKTPPSDSEFSSSVDVLEVVDEAKQLDTVSPPTPYWAENTTTTKLNWLPVIKI